VANLRCGYTTLARPFRDSDTVVGVKWYRCRKGAPTLGWESSLQSLDWMGFPWLQTGPGEVYNAPRVYHQEPWVPGANGDHVCGTEEDFRLGELYLPLLPPVQYSPEGLPLCCSPPIGGVVLGGSALVPVAGTGGVRLTGTAYVTEETHNYFATNAGGPLMAVNCVGGVPIADATTWIDQAGLPAGPWTLRSGAPRGTVSDWSLIRDGTTTTFGTAAWDGTGSRVFSLVTGPWTGTVTVHEGT